MASQRLYGSMNLTKMMDKAKAGHSAFRKANNGDIYFNVTQWINEERDAKGNDSSILLSSKKEAKDSEGKVYIGNLKKADNDTGGEAPVKPSDLSELGSLDDLPF